MASALLPDTAPQRTLLDLLSNHLILYHAVAYLPAAAVLNLAATCRDFRNLVYYTPQVFRHLDLSEVKTAQFDIPGIDHGGETWRNVQIDENLTEDEFYSGPLRGIINTLFRTHILPQVQTLILDGLAVTAELVNEILIDTRFDLRVLSLREAKHLNERLLCRLLQTVCRSSRPDGTPRLKALYIFTPLQQPQPPALTGAEAHGRGAVGAGWNAKSQAALSSLLQNAADGDAWYTRKGRILTRPMVGDWGSTLRACQGIIAFDGVLCNGPMHHNSPVFGATSYPADGSAFAVATHALAGCEKCGSAPEGWTVWGEQVPDDEGGDAARFPLLAPPPLLSSNYRVAMCPTGQRVNPSRYPTEKSARPAPRFIARCFECLRDRYCWSCHRWWCEACLPGPMANAPPPESGLKAQVIKSCWECGNNCHDCISTTQKMCCSCRGGYCIIHNEGSTMTLCDWCSGRGRRRRGRH